jgi:hypothetical protein
VTGPARRAGAAGVRRLAAALLLLAAAGCVGTAPPPAPGSQAVVRSELIFGRLKPDGAVVTDAEWRAFIAEHVTPRFPDGFTVLDAVGQYRDRQGQVQAESTKILLIVHAPDPRSRTSIQELRDIYRRLFLQESVLLIESPAHAGF